MAHCMVLSLVLICERIKRDSCNVPSRQLGNLAPATALYDQAPNPHPLSQST